MVLQDITNNQDINYDSPEYSDDDNSYYSDEDYDERPKRCLGLCILWCNDIHGIPTGNEINSHWLVHETVSLDEFFYNDLDWVESYRQNIAAYLSVMPQDLSRYHPLLRNYTDIVSRPYSPKIDIIHMDYLPGHEAVAYIKTFWLRLIQRRWKKLFQKRKTMIKNRCNLQNLHYRQIHGRWPQGLNNLPNIREIINF
tara:strand:- start:494 stop:1084 length:591 start_codon:yes stop_codon:yes gene_type:complete